MKSNLLYHSILLPSLIAIRILFHSFYLVSNTQFDPDEYWQSLEPAYCIVFAQVDSTTYQRGVSHNCVYTWEWTRRRSSFKSSSDFSTSQQYSHFSRLKHLFLDALHGPVRSHVALLPTIFIYTICKQFRWDSRDAIAFYGPYLIHGLLIVIPTDIAIGAIATMCESYTNMISSPTSRTTTSRNPNTVRNWAMFASLTNWFLAYTLTRTYSNSIECMLLSVGVALVLSALHHISWPQKEYDTRAQSILSDNVPMKSLYAKAPFFSLSISSKIALAFFLGGLSLSIRFSSIAAWIPLGLITSIRLSNAPSIRSHGLKETALEWNKCFKALGFCAFFGMLGLLLSCLVDRYYYGFWALPFLGNFHFNVLLGHGSLYGTHPFYWYFLVGLPCICGLLFPFFLYEVTFIYGTIFSLVKRSKFNWRSSIEDPYVILLLIISSYLFLHSINQHKEFRFILPILPFICILAGRAISVFELQDSVKATDGSSAVRQTRWQFRNTNVVKPFYRRRGFLIAVALILNYPHLFYLCRIHQRASIDVNKYISKYILHELEKPLNVLLRPLKASPDLYHVHYLVGCHKTPLYSHLHIRPSDAIDQIRINAWTLDCSPDCRSDPNTMCESDAFFLKPLEFFKEAYDFNETKSKTCVEGDDSIDTAFCQNTAPNTIPDVLVVDGHSYGHVREMIHSLGFEEKVFWQAVESVRIVRNDTEQAASSSTICLGFICMRIVFETIWVWVLTKVRE